MISVVFPGQGSQKVGMGSDLYNQFEYVKQIFKNADEILGYNSIWVVVKKDGEVYLKPMLADETLDDMNYFIKK